MAADTGIRLRAPNAARIKSPPIVLPPPLKWLNGTWKLTYSTLPKWRKSRDVTVTYALLPKEPATITPVEFRAVQWGTQLEESMSWRPLSGSSTSVCTAKGVSTSSGIAGEANGELVPDLYGDTFSYGERASLVYSRRGSGWPRLMSSKWEILGYGVDPPSQWGNEHICAIEGNSWIVTYVAKTPFTPAGLNILCRNGQLSGGIVEAIRSTLAELGDEITILAQRLFEIAPGVQVGKTTSLHS